MRSYPSEPHKFFSWSGWSLRQDFSRTGYQYWIQRLNRFGYLRVPSWRKYIVCKNSEEGGNMVCVENLTDYLAKRRDVKETRAGESDAHA